MPGTRRRVENAVTTNVDVRGVLAGVAPGAHTLRLTAKCEVYPNAPSTWTVAGVTGGALLVGG